MKFATNLDLGQNELRNAVLQNLSSAPSSPKAGQAYFSTASNVAYLHNGTAWRPMDAAALTDGSIAIAALAVNPLLRANHTGTQTASTISDLSTTVKAYTLDQFAAAGANLNGGGYRITNIAQASSNTDAARWDQVQSYVAAAVAGQTAVKNPARAVATANVTLSGTQTIDGVSLAANDRVLVAGQTTGTQNGLYVVAAGAWALAGDANTGSQWIEGTEILVAEGTLYGGTIWRQTTAGAITLGSTALAFVQTTRINTYTADGTTMALGGMQFSVRYSTGLALLAGGLAIDTSIVARKYSATITGDGTTTSFTVTHGLGTTDIVTGIKDSAGNMVLAEVNTASTSTVTVAFGAAPAGSTTYRVTCIG